MAHLRSSDVTLKNRKLSSERDSKVDIKLLREKFENLSDGTKDACSDRSKFSAKSPPEISSRRCSSSVSASGKFVSEETPKAPARRNKRTSRMVAQDVADNGKDATVNTFHSVSVKDRMKLFELHNNNNNIVGSPERKRLSTDGDSKADVKTVDGDEATAPPVKPPRIALRSPKVSSQVYKAEFGRRHTGGELSVSSPTGNTIPDTVDRSVRCTTVSSTEPVNGVKSPCKIPSPPRIPKAISAKTSALKSYVKHLSHSANLICDKVKNKSANIFVDLTPTTVSPPKHYETLKRSRSEEHIYAEPSECKNAVKQQDMQNGKSSLHYMCSPISEVPKTEVRGEEKCEDEAPRQLHRGTQLNKTSMRSIIYESFSMLRRPTVAIKKGQETIVEGADGDSASDVSVKDVQDRIIYVKSVKKQMSVSSICIAPKLFEVVLIIGISDSGPQVLFKYPRKLPKEYDYPLVPHLCFPDYQSLDKSAVYRSESFNFTLEIGNEEKIFGYCHRILGWPELKCGFCTNCPVAICLLSSVSAPLFYNKVLVEIEKHMVLPLKKCMEYLISLQKLGIPNAGASVSIPDNTEETMKRVIITRPLDFHTVSLDLTKALQLLDVDVVLKILSSLLLERRVLLLSHNSRNLFSCCKAVCSLLYPFQWQHLMIPVVPSCLLIQCSTESPYLLGIASADYSKILELLTEHQLLIVDVDKGLVLKCYGDEDTILPHKIHRAVVGALNLSKNMTDPTEMMRDIMISEAVVHMFVEIVGHAENHLVAQDGACSFQKEAFQKSCSSKSIQAFLQWFSESQMFEAFIEEYIWRMNYRNICHSQQYTFFEKRVEEYKWEMAHEKEKFSKKIGKTVRNIGEKLRNLKLS